VQANRFDAIVITSDQVGKHLLDYDPVPSAFHGCVPTDTKTRVSSLG
jgi:hypothetical protein